MKPFEKTIKATFPVKSEEIFSDERYTLIIERDSNAKNNQGDCLTKISADFEFDFKEDDIQFLNGYQSWTYCPERTKDQYDTSMLHCPGFLNKMFGFTRYSDDWFSGRLTKKELKEGRKKGYSYAYIRRGDEYIFFGSLSEDIGFTRIDFIPGGKRIVFTKDVEGRNLAEGERFTALDIYFKTGTESEVFDGWFSEMRVKALVSLRKTGYTSWYNCYQNINEAGILRDLEGMRSLSDPPDIFQIDDGFETYVGDWLSVDPVKFPNGLSPVLEKICEDGFTPGIWLAPFICEKKSEIFSKHKDWLLYDNGEPVYTGGNWSGGYSLDFYNDEVRKYISDVIKHYKEMGFRLFKLDFLYGACMVPRPFKTRGEIMKEAMEFLRNECGDTQILACGVPLASAFGRVEYCRIGPDMSLDFDDKLYMRLFHNERPSTMHTQRNTFYRRQLDKRAFLNDPDVFLLRDDNTSLSDDQKKTLATINAIFGSVLFSSDDFGRYTGEKLEFFKYLLKFKNADNVKIISATPGDMHKATVSYTVDGVYEEKDFIF